MFKNPFSFSGRIRRLEYGLSYLIFICSFFVIGLIIEFVPKVEALIMLMIIPAYWFLLAQGAKRCHDLGNSGFFQVIPFYGLFMLFQEGNHGPNKHGYNPKELDTPVKKEPFLLRIALPPGKSNIDVLSEILCFALLNVLLIELFNNYIQNNLIRYAGIALSICICYFILLTLANNKGPLPELKSYLLRQRLTYATILSLSIYLYNLSFNYYSFRWEDISYAIFLVFLIWGYTYFPFILYKTIFKKRKEEMTYED